MTARPILFSGDEVRGTMDGRKTWFRRPVKRDMANAFDPPRGPADVAAGYPWFEASDGMWHKAVDCCPYGRPGDLLWVRETWTSAGGGVWHRADCDRGPVCDVCQWPDGSPLVLEVVSVRVERVQEITEEGARAEGAPVKPGGNVPMVVNEHGFGFGWNNCRNWFAGLWDSIYGKRPGLSWDANPWVWAVEFKVAASTLSEAQAILEAA